MILTLSDNTTFSNLILTGWLGHPPWTPDAKPAALDLTWSDVSQVNVILTEDYYPVGSPFERESFRNGIPLRVRKGHAITIPRAEAAGICAQLYSARPTGGLYPDVSSAIVGGDVQISGFGRTNVFMRSGPARAAAITGTPTFSIVHGVNPTLTITNPGANALLTGASGTPPVSAFTVYNGGSTPSDARNVNPMPVSSVSVNATSITLGLVGTINLGDVVTLTYFAPPFMQSNSTPLQDTAGNLFPLIAAHQVTVS